MHPQGEADGADQRMHSAALRKPTWPKPGRLEPTRKRSVEVEVAAYVRLPYRLTSLNERANFQCSATGHCKG